MHGRRPDCQPPSPPGRALRWPPGAKVAITTSNSFLLTSSGRRLSPLAMNKYAHMAIRHWQQTDSDRHNAIPKSERETFFADFGEPGRDRDPAAPRLPGGTGSGQRDLLGESGAVEQSWPATPSPSRSRCRPRAGASSAPCSACATAPARCWVPRPRRSRTPPRSPSCAVLRRRYQGVPESGDSGWQGAWAAKDVISGRRRWA
jgi:hypothetical protein